MSTDLVAIWEVSLGDGLHVIEFEHGTTSGKRVIRVDGKELYGMEFSLDDDIYRHNWMFKLVGKEEFNIGKAKCRILIDAISGFAYEYTLEVNGKSLKKFSENQTKILRSWILMLGETGIRVTLEKDTLDVWVNGDKMETAGAFVDDGTETHFEIGSRSAYIKATSSGTRKGGIKHQLFVDDQEIPLAKD